MTDKVPPAEAPDHFAEIAAQLHGIADDLAKLAGVVLPEPYFSIDIHPHGADDAAITAAVDAVSNVLLGKAGTTYSLAAGGYHHGARGARGLVQVAVYDRVSDPAERDRANELERLRAEVAELRAAVPAGALPVDLGAFGYSREADDPTPVSPARVPLHTGGVVDGGQLVDETEAPRTELLAIVPTASGMTFTTAPVGAVVDPVRRAHVVELTEAVAEQLDGRDRRACVNPGEPEHDHAMCEDVVAEEQERERVRVAADTVPVPAEDATLTLLRDIDPDASMEAHYDAEAETGIFSPARRQELLWKRAVGERGGWAEALEHAHELALFEDNDRARQAVVSGLRPGESGRIVNPSLAWFLAAKEHAKRHPTHLVFLLGDTACGIEPEEIPAADRQTSDVDAVTCPACRQTLKPSAKDVYA